MKPLFLFLLVAILPTLGCADATRRLQTEEKALDTDGPVTHLFHSAVYYPFEIASRFDGYLIGIEKVPRPLNGIAFRNRDEYGITETALNAKFDDGKTMAVTHVLRHSADARNSANCALFNAYVQNATSVAKQLVPTCPSTTVVFRDPKLAVVNSWQALDALRDDMLQRIADRYAAIEKAKKESQAAAAKGWIVAPRSESDGTYTHLVVVVMGWNTVQEEAVRNINSLVWNLGRAHDERVAKASPSSPPAVEPRFNPLVIGVTWPSQWSSKWLDPAIKIASFPTKAGDADEVGMSWLGVLLHDTLPTVRRASELPVVVLGHSFGAKAASIATCAGPAVMRPGASLPVPLGTTNSVVDVLVNLEPAYLSERVFGRSSHLLQNIVYPPQCSQASRFVITASAGDKAVPLPFWGTYLGEEKSYKKFCAADVDVTDKVVANCAVADAFGDVKLSRTTASSVYYVDATKLIADNAYETGGGSHSDIYRLEHGRMIYAAVMGQGLWAGR